MGFIPARVGWFNGYKLIGIISINTMDMKFSIIHINKRKDKTYPYQLIRKKTFDMMQYPSMLNTAYKIGVERSLLKIVRSLI